MKKLFHIVVFICLLEGCSWIGMDTVPQSVVNDHHPSKRAYDIADKCDSSKVAPGLDLSMSILLTAADIVALSLSLVFRTDRDSRNDMLANGLDIGAIGGLVPIIIYGASAGYGFRRASECKDYLLSK